MSDLVPNIMIEHVAGPPLKRRRLNVPPLDAAGNSPCLLEVDTAAPTPSDFTAHGHICEDTIVCFGMIIDQPVTGPADGALSPSLAHETIVYEPPHTLRHSNGIDIFGQLHARAGEILRILAADGELILQLALSAFPIAAEPDTKLSQRATRFLGIIIYGPRHRFSDVGDFVTKCGHFLEDPIGCNRNAPYMNPQCLFSLHESPPMTYDLQHMQQQSVDTFTRTSADILAVFETTDSIKESDNPTALRTCLKAYQRQALTFFLRRERGLHPTEDGFGIWSRRSSEGKTHYVNVITGEMRSQPGPMWRGGLLADEMGVGKTLSMIALIASDKDANATGTWPIRQDVQASSLNSTLVIVPLSLLTVWETQLKNHVHSGRLTWCTHHGKRRFRPINTVRPPDIVFTTYQTVERERRKKSPTNESLFSHHWKRIILDEAHIIRNHNTATASAISALRATSRWAVSGTPIQNNLTDFLGLFKFLQFVPYDDSRAFDDDISALWRNCPVEEATESFKRLLSSVMIRRTKVVLDLTNREDKIMRLPFSELEKEYYQMIEQPVVDMLDQPTDESRPSVPWMTAIQQINKLRLVCNLGTFVPSSQCGPSRIGDIDDKSAELAARFSMSGEACAHCLQPIEASPSGNELGSSTMVTIYHSTCSRFYCADCAELLQYQAPQPCDCTSGPSSCPLRHLKSLLPTPRLTPTGSLSPSPMDVDDNNDISSKVKALISQIRYHPDEKHVVFSSWTSSLDMVERGLRSDPAHLIQSVRIDGKVAPNKRGYAIQQLSDDPNIRVILITIGCGACGLDLTAASRVHLLEPQWNPSLEDQALARVHRLGQTRPVTTIRYIMENSFEEHILKVQDRKKLLATTLLSNGSALEILRSLLHESKVDNSR
ncbi:hypothetical protein CC86DRAFT_461991 [Ophiobolus disseminans]|uniref:Uncharacterized protein n=1 Tax=Ophiobolus disseminans TaxID=1469910 RepID=A0A6A7AMH4_9PLEO|nr:hypothetical protein CC86DRAFT_461991 [Ophiobolus disseminans]